MLKKIRRIYTDFCSEKKRNLPQAENASFFRYLFFRLKYKIPETFYFKNKLYDKSIDTDEALKDTTRVMHGWKNSLKRNVPDASFGWRLFHYIDFTISRILYPGLDSRDYFMYEFYNLRHSLRKTFVTNGYLHRLDEKLNGLANSRDRDLIENKGMFNALFPDIITRKWIVSKGITREKLGEFLDGLDEVIVKPLDGMQGLGIFKKTIQSENDVDELFQTVHEKDYIIEEIVKQSWQLGRFNPSSVNTIRVYSVRYKNEIIITGAVFRLGRTGRITDNYTTGGMAAEIDVDLGIITSRAINYREESYFVHPDTKEVILGAEIPKWDEVKETVKKAHLRIPQFGYIAWDVVVTEDGQITFLEANTCGGFELQQHPCHIGKKHIYDQFMK